MSFRDTDSTADSAASPASPAAAASPTSPATNTTANTSPSPPGSAEKASREAVSAVDEGAVGGTEAGREIVGGEDVGAEVSTDEDSSTEDDDDDDDCEEAVIAEISDVYAHIARNRRIDYSALRWTKAAYTDGEEPYELLWEDISVAAWKELEPLCPPRLRQDYFGPRRVLRIRMPSYVHDQFIAGAGDTIFDAFAAALGQHPDDAIRARRTQLRKLGSSALLLGTTSSQSPDYSIGWDDSDEEYPALVVENDVSSSTKDSDAIRYLRGTHCHTRAVLRFSRLYQSPKERLSAAADSAPLRMSLFRLATIGQASTPGRLKVLPLKVLSDDVVQAGKVLTLRLSDLLRGDLDPDTSIEIPHATLLEHYARAEARQQKADLRRTGKRGRAETPEEYELVADPSEQDGDDDEYKPPKGKRVKRAKKKASARST